MIELNTTLFILMLEGLLALFIIIVIIFLLTRRKAKGEQQASDKTIRRLKDSAMVKQKKLNALLSASCEMEPAELNDLLNELSRNEKQLYKKIMELFLQRNVQVLESIDQYVDNISEPYLKLLAQSANNPVEQANAEEVENKIQLLLDQNKRMGEQLSVAMQTIDELSAEYSRVFNGTQTELELTNSSQKMLEIFENNGQQFKALSEEE